MSTSRKRILFVSEAVTLAHLARPFALASNLPGAEFEVHFAHHPRYRALLGDVEFPQHDIESISPEQFAGQLARGAPLYDERTLTDYVEADLALIERVQPSVVVGDFRLSLSVSCRLANIPYVALSNAYWSPAVAVRYTVPELPLTRALGPALAQLLFRLARPVAFAQHARPLNQVRRHYGLPSLGADLRRVYTDADRVLYADVPDWYRSAELPKGQSFIGPVLWEPDVAHPDWLADLPRDRPVVYVTMGSSGSAALVPVICAALAELPVTGVVSTAGAPVPRHLPGNVYAAPYLPGGDIMQLAAAVICNGGSPTTQQALYAGVPVVGLAGNLDQYLNMGVVEAAGAGILLRSGTARVGQLAAAVRRALQDKELIAAAAQCSQQLRQFDGAGLCAEVLRELATTGRSAASNGTNA